MGGVETMAAAIEADLAARLPRQRVTQRRNLALLAAAVLCESEVNLMALGAVLPMATGNRASRFQKLKRILANRHIRPDEVMAPYAREVLAALSANGQQLVLVIDQSQATRLHRHELLMVAVRLGGRALPLAWIVRETAGAIGFAEQKEVLERVAAWLPDGAKPVLMGDRFYGTPDLIAWCAARRWSWRLRLKANLLVYDKTGGETTLRECFEDGQWLLADVRLSARQIPSHVAMVHETGHPEPWIIALSEAPTTPRALDYGLRWGIEAMFSDLKSRGFDLESSQLRKADRIDRLLLGLAIAIYWAVSTGMWDQQTNALSAERKTPDQRPPRCYRSWLSLFTRGLRRLKTCIANAIAPPPLWSVWQTDSW